MRGKSSASNSSVRKSSAQKPVTKKVKGSNQKSTETVFSPIIENCRESEQDSVLSTEGTTDHDDDEDLPSTQPVDDRVLKDVITYVEVRSTNDNRSKAICKELVQLGAVVAKKFSDDVTHVVFKEGCKRTINKAKKKGIHLVSVLWVDSCKRNQEHVSERLYPATLPDEKGTPLFLNKLKKAKSMQPQDFEVDVARSAERCTKKKKRLDTDRLLSGDNTPMSSPQIAGILVQDTQPRTPMANMYTPVRLTIPDTPPSMRARLKELERIKNEESEGNYESEEPLPSPKVADDEPLQRKLFAEYTNSSGTATPSSTAGEVNVSIEQETSSASHSLPVTEKKSKAKGRRKSVASIKFSDNIDEPVKSLRKSSRRKSVASVMAMNSVNQNKCDIDNDITKSGSTITDESVDRDGKSISTCTENPQEKKHETVKGKTTGKGKRKSVGFYLKNEKDKSIDQSPKVETSSTTNTSSQKECNQNNNSKTERKSAESTINPESVSSSCCDLDHTDECDGTEVISNATDPVDINLQDGCNTEKEKNEISTGRKNCSRKKLLKSSDCEPHSFLIEPSKCSQKERPKILEKANVNKKSQQGKKRKIEVEDCLPPDDHGTPKKRMCHREDYLDDVSNIPFDDTQSETAVSLTSESLHNEVNASMSAVFSESTYPSFCGRPPPRQSIDEFNLRAKFNVRKNTRKRDRKVLSESTSTRQSSDSENQSSSSDLESLGKACSNRNRKLSNSTSPVNKSPQRPTLVMTSLHSHEQDVVLSIIKTLKGFTVADNVNSSCSHVVCGGARRTLNILHAITQGCWILKKEWVLESLEAGYWLPEKNYEMTDCFPIAKVTREEKESTKENFCMDLFSSVGLIYLSSKTKPPRNHLVTLLKKCEGKVTTSKSKAQLYIGHDFLPDTTSVTPLWILDCITQYKTLDVDKYLLGKSKRESSPEY